MVFVRFRELFPSARDWLSVRWTLLRASVLGFFIGVLPGAGATIASFAVYAAERNLARDRKRFGEGRLEGLAAGEAGNSGASIGTMLPMLSLGSPGSGATAVMLGGFLIWGVQPGPLLFEQQPAFVWGLIISMSFGNMMLLAMNVLLVPVFAQALRVPKAILAPLIIVFCVAGAYATNNSMANVWIMFGFGLLGLLLRFAQVPIAPPVLGLVLGLAFEKHLRRSLQLSDNGLMIFIDRPISLGLMIVPALVALAPFIISRLVARPTAKDAPSLRSHCAWGSSVRAISRFTTSPHGSAPASTWLRCAIRRRNAPATAWTPSASQASTPTPRRCSPPRRSAQSTSPRGATATLRSSGSRSGMASTSYAGSRSRQRLKTRRNWCGKPPATCA